MSKAVEAVEKALRERFDFIDIGQLHDDDTWQELSEIAANAAINSLFPSDVVVACRPWRTNADLIYDVWRLGYVTGDVYDITPGEVKSAFGRSQWTRRLPADSEGNLGTIVHNWSKLDFRYITVPSASYHTVLFDPPYKLNGNPDGLPELSRRYGVDIPAKWRDRHLLMLEGFVECLRLSSRYVLVKGQDQVVSGRIRWQTDMFKRVAEGCPLNRIDHGLHRFETNHRARLVDRFDMIGHHVPQPMRGREQKHAHARPSSLLVFEKE